MSKTANVVKGFNPYLHGARGLFAMMIVFFHVVNSRLPTFDFLSRSLPLFLLRSTEHGVELFFAISGIVIVGALSRAAGPLTFAAERATRIYPVLWVTVLVIAGLSAATGFEGRGAPSVPVLLANLLALPPIIPGPLVHPAAWSLSFELLFYFLCAAGWVLRRRLGVWAVLLIAPIAAWLLYFHVRAILMPVGMLVAVVLSRKPTWAQAVFTPGFYLALFLFAWEIVCQANGADLMHSTALDLTRGWQPVAVAAALISATLGFAGLLGGRGVLARLLNTPPMQFLGSVSYSLYLWHPIVMSMVKHMMYVEAIPQKVGPFSQLVFLAIATPPSLLVAWVSQQTLEQRVTLWLRGVLEPNRRRRHELHPPQTAASQVNDSPA